jgi:PAS domain S-box-containing protein
MFNITFDNHPDPMWIYDLHTLRFLEVNAAATIKYGYSREEFLAMTLKDIRPVEDLPAMLQHVRKAPSGFDHAGIWRHRLKDGREIHVDIVSHSLEYRGVDAKLVCARDVSRLVDLESSNRELLESERRLRQEAEHARLQLQQVFESMPGNLLVLDPDHYEIVAVSDAFLAATMTRREQIMGRGFFEIFPGDPDEPLGNGARNLRRSLERVRAEGVSDVMGVQRYPMIRPDSQGGGFEERYWSPVNSPVKSATGEVAYIVHRVEDVTELVRSGTAAHRSLLARLDEGAAQQELDVVLRSQELRAANIVLREHQANLRTVQRLLGVGIWKLDVDSGVLSWSDNIHAMYGVDKTAFGHSFEDYVRLVHPEDRDEMVASYQVFEAGGDDHFEFSHRIVRPTGGLIHVRGLGERVRGPNGKRFITGIVQDTTAQKAAEARIRESDLLMRVAGRVARLGAWRIILEPEEVIWSADTAAIHEEPADFRPTIDGAINYYAPEHRQRIREAFYACATEAAPFDELLQFVTAKGKRIWVRSIGEPEYGDDGRVCAIRGALQDVSELIEARQRVKRLSDRLRETLENISDAFFTLDRDWRFVFLNAHAEQLLERSRHTLVGRNIWAEFPDATGTSFQQQYEAAVNDRRTIRFTEWYPPLQRWFQVNAHPTEDGLAVYFSDVTERRRLEEELRQAQKLEAIGQLTGGVAHDFNNLLTVILGNAEMLHTQLPDQPRLCAFADMIITAAESGAALTSRLLAFARRQVLEPQPIDLNKLTDRMLALLGRTLGKDIEMEVVATEELWIAELDPGQMENALLNLAINARDAMPGGGRLTISTTNARLETEQAAARHDVPPGHYVAITVSDTGTGMPSEVIEKVFDPFFSTKGSRGNGLGLSMVYGFVKQSGGHARITSKVGDGTTVRLYFPRAPYSHEAIQPELPAPDLVIGNEHILVVEDYGPLRENLVLQLTELGYRVSTAADGSSALQAIMSGDDIALLLTDVVLPGGMNGRELADSATALDPGLKVLFTSGYAENAIMRDGRIEPGMHLLGKPYRRRELALKVRKVLDAEI